MKDKLEQFGRIGVLMGGVSSEREISLKSGHAIIEAFHREGCEVVPVDIVDDAKNNILLLLKEASIDVAFIALHGKLGEDGAIQLILEECQIPYTGSGTQASRLAFDKTIAQNLFKKNNIRIPSYVTLSKGDQPDSEAIKEELGGFPIVVKPACEGSSIGISLVESQGELAAALQCAWGYDEKIILEQYIKGRELTVGILDQQALPAVEIRPKHNLFNFESKYTKGMTEYIVPANISDDIAQELSRIALKAHQVLACSDFSRIDFMVDDNQMPYVLEINTIPGFTSTSLLPMAACAHGLNFNQLCMKLIELAYGKKEKIKNTTLR